jgi:hypothetical protein
MSAKLDEKFNKDIEILKKNPNRILEMKNSINKGKKKSHSGKHHK